MALTRSGARGRLAGRDNLFYLAVLALIFTITLVWVGIYILYAVSGADGSPAAVVLAPSATATTVPATATARPTVTATPDIPPGTPTGLTAVASAQGVTLNWNRNAEADFAGYDVLRAEGSSARYTKLNAKRLQRLETTFIDDKAPAGRRLRYRVVAVDRAGQVSPAATIEVPMLEPTATPQPTSTATPEPTVAPTATFAPSPVPPTPTAQVIYVPGPPVEVTRVVVPPTAPAATATSLPAPTSTAEPPATFTPEPTVLPTPEPVPTETPVPPALPTELPPLQQPSPEPSSAPSAQASSPAPEVVPTLEPAPELPTAPADPNASTTP